MLCEDCWSYLRDKLPQEVAVFENTMLHINSRRDAARREERNNGLALRYWWLRAIRLIRMARLRPTPINLHAYYK
jgi:hypothetical protein